MQSYLTTSQIRACTYPHRERPTEKDTLSRGPHKGGNAFTPRNSTLLACLCCHELAKSPASSNSRLIAMSFTRMLLAPISMACAPSNLFFIRSDWLVWLSPSDQGHAFSRQLARAWDAFYSCDRAKVHAHLGWNSALNLISFKPHTLSQMATEPSPESSAHLRMSLILNCRQDRCTLHIQTSVICPVNSFWDHSELTPGEKM